MGIGKATQMNSLANWTEDNDSPVCADPSPFQIWDDWGAYQRDLFVTNLNGDLVYRENITSGIPDSLEGFIYSLSNLSNDTMTFPSELSLHQNFPNPFNPSTTIRYEISNSSHIKLTIYNLNGKIIRNLLNQNEIAGSRSILWNGEDNFGIKVSSGTYIYSIETGDYSEVRKMVLLK